MYKMSVLSNLSCKDGVSLFIYLFFWVILSNWDIRGVKLLNSSTIGLLPSFFTLCLYLVAAILAAYIFIMVIYS